MLSVRGGHATKADLNISSENFTSFSLCEKKKSGVLARETVQQCSACSFRGPRINFQHPPGGSQVPVTPFPGAEGRDSVPSSGL